MLDLVEHETRRVESRFLEPACGTGNFLVEVLRRKLAVVTGKYGKSRPRWEPWAVLAVSSVYGVDILLDNVLACRERLLGVVEAEHARLFPMKPAERDRLLLFPEAEEERSAAVHAVWFLLNQNIVHGDALTMTRGDGEPIVFPEWTTDSTWKFGRADYRFDELLGEREDRAKSALFSDAGDEVCIPRVVAQYEPLHFLRLGTERMKRIDMKRRTGS